jgi:hypothetical protein
VEEEELERRRYQEDQGLGQVDWNNDEGRGDGGDEEAPKMQGSSAQNQQPRQPSGGEDNEDDDFITIDDRNPPTTTTTRATGGRGRTVRQKKAEDAAVDRVMRGVKNASMDDIMYDLDDADEEPPLIG